MSNFLIECECVRVKKVRKSNRAEVKRLKEEHGIWTHNDPTGGKWLAFSVPACHERLKGYGLTDEEKENPMALFAGYCRIMDEAELTEEGHATEFAAVSAVASKLCAATKPDDGTTLGRVEPSVSAPLVEDGRNSLSRVT